METNKTLDLVAKIFIIIGMVTGALAIYPLVLGFIVLSKMKKGELSLAWKIVTLLLVSLVAGIILLVTPAVAPAAAPKAENNSDNTPAE